MAKEDPTTEKKKHRKEWLTLAKKYLDKPQIFLAHLLWTIETQIAVFGKAHQWFVYIQQNKSIM